MSNLVYLNHLTFEDGAFVAYDLMDEPHKVHCPDFTKEVIVEMPYMGGVNKISFSNLDALIDYIDENVRTRGKAEKTFKILGENK